MFEKQYFSSQIITSEIMFLTNGNPRLESLHESCPPVQTELAGPYTNSQGKGQAPIHAHRKMAASTHSILMAYNRVSYTYVTTHFLI